MTDRAGNGRKAEAAANDARVLSAARRVLTAAPDTPMAEIAAAADVGIGSLYRRFPSKDALVRTLCLEGMNAIAEAARISLAETDHDPWGAFERFLRRAVGAGAGSLRGLAGTFRPDDELNAAAARMNALITTLLARTQELGAVRDDIGTADVGLLFEMLRAIRVGTSARSDALRHRYLDLFAPALRAPADSQLTEPAATWAEISGTWNP
jgi:AcrR family transcriptional regulator